ncbi:LOW QUALITY PROTEIN: protein FAM169B [Egretta garzetta]|nr:LOW QUALITY PROTEIN: protein FAM169B [Egretta garzetta]
MAGSPRLGFPEAARTPQNTRAFAGELCSVACGHDRASPGSSLPCSQRPAFTGSPEGDGAVRPACAKQRGPEQAATGGFALYPSVRSGLLYQKGVLDSSRAPSWILHLGCLCLVDTLAGDPEVLQGDAETYYEKLLTKSSSAADVFSIPGGEEVKLEDSCVCFVPLYRNNPTCKMLLLTHPKDKKTVLAVYLNRCWWPVEDVVKTADPSRDGLISVQTFGERIVLFVLNYIIFGMLEGSSANDAFFLPHSATECAKILWRNGEAVAFYSVKMKGSLCDGRTGQCYLLPVLDTIFVRRKYRRDGLGMKMLHDFCQSFMAEDALGISCPISAAMYQVCQKFLQTYPEEQKRLWEVEAPGDWNQRVNIWLKIQMESSPAGRITCVLLMLILPQYCAYYAPREIPRESTGQGVEYIPGVEKVAGDAAEEKDDTAGAGTLNSQGPEQEDLEQDEGNTQQCKGFGKRADPGGLVGDKATKQFRIVP